MYWQILPKKGCSNIREQKKLIIPIFPLNRKYKFALIGDREFGSVKLEAKLQDVLTNAPVKGWPADAQRLANRIQRHWREWFTFLDHPELKPDNNDAERALRPVVVHRKVTGGARSDWGAQ